MTVREFEFPQRTFAERKRQVASILWILHLNGPIVDEGGGASTMLREALQARGCVISSANLNAIMGKMDHPGAEYGYLIRRRINGKRTMRIELQVNPDRNPFPRNPFSANNTARYQSKGAASAEPVEPADTGAGDELTETYTRQALVQPPVAANGASEDEDVLDRLRRMSAEQQPTEEPEPETEPVVDPAPEAEATSAKVGTDLAVPKPEEYMAAARTVDGFLGTFDDGALRGNPVAGSSDLLTQAIGLISRAMTMRIEEEAARQEDAATDVALLVDERMAAYVKLIDANEKLKRDLGRSHERERELVGIVRTLQAVMERQGINPEV